MTIPARSDAIRMRQSGNYIPESLKLQWHITERCNLRCRHCYQEPYSGYELSFQELVEILEQYKHLLDIWKKQTGRKITGHVSVTGGEPFIRQDFVDLLQLLSANRKHFTFSIMTNGWFIDKNMARRLRKLRPRRVQVSIEGTKVTHDHIRGDGSFDRTVLAIKHLVREHIRTWISFTAHRGNYREFADVAQLGQRLKVSRVWADRLIPAGSGSNLKEELLTVEETCKFFEIMLKARAKVKRRWFGRTKIAMHRSLQFLVAGGNPHRCTAGDTLITVQSNGDLYPCRRMPIRVGNLLETSLADLYHNDEVFWALRDRHRVSEGCELCCFSRLCQGGLRCLSYAATGDPFKADPGCWHATVERGKIEPSAY